MCKPFQKEKNNYTLYGALFGFLFPIGATLFECFNVFGTLSWEHVWQAQRENVLLWIIDSAPFWLGLFARLGGVRQDILLEQKREEVSRFASFPIENPFPVLRVSWEGEILFSNPPGMEFLAQWNRGIGETVPDPFLEPLKKIQLGQAVDPVEMKNGEGFLLFNLVGIPELKYVNFYSSDISKRKTMESDLVLAKEKAEKGDRAKTEFLAKMSHELRTPMNAILGFTQLLQMDPQGKFTDQQRENLAMIYSAGEHLLELINEVLDLSRVESGKLELSIQPVDAQSIIKEVMDISGPLGDEYKVSLEYIKMTDQPCVVLADPLRLKQVIINLVSNGVKYNKPEGRVTLTCEVIENNKIRFEVQDTGNGIPEYLEEELFKPFKRFDSNSENIEGTGIGLAISKQLVELMGGSLEFESEVGAGSRFFFDLLIPETNIKGFPAQKISRDPVLGSP